MEFGDINELHMAANPRHYTMSHSRLCVFIFIMITKAVYILYLEFTTYIKK
jgi:hypothetical protein